MLGLVGLVALVTLVAGPGFAVREAQAVVGRPLTPMSYAGVARRTTRRAVAAGTYYRAPTVVAPAPVYRPPTTVIW